MDFDRDNIRLVVDEDRLSSLPDELIHRILHCNDTKYAVQTSLLSPRWRFLWKSVSRLNFSSRQFENLPKFSKFVKKFLLHRNHHVEVSSLNLNFHGAASQFFVRNIANYAFSHNVQELTIVSDAKKHHEFPLCLFNSPTLKHFSLRNNFLSTCITPKTPWDFPALTTLYLGEITLCDDNRQYVDLFSKCVNLQTITLVNFIVKHVEIFEIKAPRLSNLVLKDGKFLNVVNVVAPNLENLTIDCCFIKSLNAPHGIACLCYSGYDPPQWFKDGFHSLETVAINLYFRFSIDRPYNEEDARSTINMLQAFHSTRFLTLNIDILECISLFPDLLSDHPSPFGNLNCLNIESSMRMDDYKIKMSIEARNFFLENCPSATLIMAHLLEPPPTKAMKAKEAREKRKANVIANIKSILKELQTPPEQENMLARKPAKERTTVALENLSAELQVWTKRKRMQGELEKKVHVIEMIIRLKAHVRVALGEMKIIMKQENDDLEAIVSKRDQICSLGKKLSKRLRLATFAPYSDQFVEASRLISCLRLETFSSRQIVAHYEKYMLNYNLTYENSSKDKVPPEWQPSTSSSSLGCYGALQHELKLLVLIMGTRTNFHERLELHYCWRST
ncbi:F-box domain, cyclin-like protein [Artemisia annua]|uniref:F-box domain, cyclin-like protein n=1 Tax=Artemisia annua TaxID=35608 RepID=A0A2U1N5U6_ARTAN|nr:F-box domain, cyclin-like protein [Artemisia annua]